MMLPFISLCRVAANTAVKLMEQGVCSYCRIDQLYKMEIISRSQHDHTFNLTFVDKVVAMSSSLRCGP